MEFGFMREPCGAKSPLSYRGAGQVVGAPEVAADVEEEEPELLSPAAGLAAGFSAGLASVLVSEDGESEDEAPLFGA
jgi:hypothetical protein